MSQQVSARATVVSRGGGRLTERLREWRRLRAKAEGVPAYVVFDDKTLMEIAQQMPVDWADLAGISGVGPTKLDRYADQVLTLVDAARPTS